MSSWLLDTTALLAHFRQEAGAETVQTILGDASSSVHISSLSITEFARRLRALGADAVEARATALEYAGLVSGVIPVDVATATRAFEIGEFSSSRLPIVDALIAASASILGATLLHCDAHFDGLASDILTQQSIR